MIIWEQRFRQKEQPVQRSSHWDVLGKFREQQGGSVDLALRAEMGVVGKAVRAQIRESCVDDCN